VRLAGNGFIFQQLSSQPGVRARFGRGVFTVRSNRFSTSLGDVIRDMSKVMLLLQSCLLVAEALESPFLCLFRNLLSQLRI
jgi:hypothetical protein